MGDCIVYSYKNTRLFYTCEGKRNSVILKGEMTDADFEAMQSSCNPGGMFVPHNVGLDTDWDKDYRKGETGFFAHLDSYELVPYPDRIGVDVVQMIFRFKAWKGKWDGSELHLLVNDGMRILPAAKGDYAPPRENAPYEGIQARGIDERVWNEWLDEELPFE